MKIVFFIAFLLFTAPQRSSNNELNTYNQSSGVQKSKAAPHVDVLSSDYAEMNLGTTSTGGRSTGPTLSPKENIKKLKSSFFGCTDTSAESDYVNCSTAEPSLPRTPRKTDDNDVAGEYALMDPKLTRASLSSQTSPVVLATKKSILFTSNNNPDKVLANTQSKADGFKPISSNFDGEMRGSKNQSPKGISTPASSTSFNRQHSAPTQRLQSTPNPLNRPHDAAQVDCSVRSEPCIAVRDLFMALSTARGTQADQASHAWIADNGGYELLELRGSNTDPVIVHGRLARPNSVNSEKSTKHSSNASGVAPFTSSTRPNSANSDRLQTISASSSSSSSSMLCGSGANECDSSSTISTSSSISTILRPQSSSFLSSGSEYSASSRPSSVVSVVDPTQSQPTAMLTSRPPSVSSERELHYSILDLPPCSNSVSLNLITNNNNSNIASTQAPEQSTFTYAQIDFVKSSEPKSQQHQQ